MYKKNRFELIIEIIIMKKELIVIDNHDVSVKINSTHD